MKQEKPISKALPVLYWCIAALWLVVLILDRDSWSEKTFLTGCRVVCFVCWVLCAILYTLRYRRQEQIKKLRLDAIVAVYSDWGIGCDGTQPIVVKADRRHFREVTGSAAVIVGRRTMADFPGGQPLKGRRNIVLTRQALVIPGAETAKDVGAALELVRTEPQAFVIGGASVYLAMMPYIRRVFVTKIDAAPVSDAFFPDLDALPDWKITERSGPMQQDDLTYEFLTYEREE